MKKTITYDFVYQPFVESSPIPVSDLHKNACSGDTVTVNTWYDTWLKNYKSCVERFGDLGEKTVGKLYGINKYKPAIVLASGPSLKDCIEGLKINKSMQDPILSVSTLHNFGYLQDQSDECGVNIHADYYVSLDAGKIVLGDVTEGRKHPPEYYWEKTKDKKLIAVSFSDPELFEKWQGEVYLFNASIPDVKFQKEANDIQLFSHVLSSGGNAGGTAVYVAKAVFGSYSIMMCGLDFCFDYDDTFHSYATHYDKLGQYLFHTDCFGVQRKTWGSYMNFKFYMDWLSQTIPGDWINCSSGLLGAYREGNLRSFTYLPLEAALNRFFMAERVWLDKFEEGSGKLLDRKEIKLKDVFADPKYPLNLTVY